MMITEKKIALIFTAICIIFGFFWIKNEDRKKKQVLKDYKFVKGSFFSLNTVGSFQNPNFRYKYYVDGHTYKRTIRISYGYFEECEFNPEDCSNKQFWVAYELGNPENSLVNWRLEIQDIKNPEPPDNLDSFE